MQVVVVIVGDGMVGLIFGVVIVIGLCKNILTMCLDISDIIRYFIILYFIILYIIVIDIVILPLNLITITIINITIIIYLFFTPLQHYN